MTRRFRFALPGLLLSALPVLGADETVGPAAPSASHAPAPTAPAAPARAATAPAPSARPAPPSAPAARPAKATPETPDPADCIARARGVLAQGAPAKDDKVRAAAY